MAASGKSNQVTVTLWQKIANYATTYIFWVTNHNGAGSRGLDMYLGASGTDFEFDSSGCCDRTT
jgi:hypothetical protein